VAARSRSCSRRPPQEFDDGKIVITDPQYFTIFQYDWLAGNPAAAMTGPFHVVLTESRARQYFGSASPDQWLGKEVIYVEDSLHVTVSGIVRDWKGNTATHHPGIWCFALLSQRTPPARVDDQFQQLAVTDPDRWSKMDLKLEPLADIHFNTADRHGDFASSIYFVAQVKSFAYPYHERSQHRGGRGRRRIRGQQPFSPRHAPPVRCQPSRFMRANERKRIECVSAAPLRLVTYFHEHPLIPVPLFFQYPSQSSAHPARFP
jgi:hypothetical protein